MKNLKNRMTAAFLCAATLFAECAFGQTAHFVWKDNPNEPENPYTNGWASAAREINAAITASMAGAVIWVTNGVYDAGGTPVGGLTNRVYIDRAVAVRSVNGPSNTFIVGRWHDSGVTVFGDAAVRCLYMASGASIEGFTLTNGATLVGDGWWSSTAYGGGVYGQASSVISNCIITDNRAGQRGGGAYNGIYHDCEIAGNTAAYSYGGGVYTGIYYNCRLIGNCTLGAHAHGGGAYGSTMYGCVLDGNRILGSPGAGGGMSGGVLYNCTVTNNRAASGGGGVNASVLYGCVLANNVSGSGQQGGGAYNSTLYNCTVLRNTTHREGGGVYNSVVYNSTLMWNVGLLGGGAYGGTLYNCALAGNMARPYWGNMGYGGGANKSVLYNCTITGNTASRIPSEPTRSYVGGTYSNTLYNCIVFSNATADGDYTNWYGDVFANSCSLPVPPGAGNIGGDPKFVDPGRDFGTNHVAGNYRLTRESPCIDMGAIMGYMTDPSVLATNAWLGEDLDGNPRIRHKSVDMGAYEKRMSRGSVFSAE